MSLLGRDLVARANTPAQNLAGSAALVVLAPLLILATALALMLRPFARPVAMSADEVAHYLRDFRDGTGEEWHIDDLLSERIADPRLESIRQRLLQMDDITDRAALSALIAEAEALVVREDLPAKP